MGHVWLGPGTSGHSSVQELAASLPIAVAEVTSPERPPTGKGYPCPLGCSTAHGARGQASTADTTRGAPGAPMAPWKLTTGSQCHPHAGHSQQGERCPAPHRPGKPPLRLIWGWAGVSPEHSLSPGGFMVPVVAAAGTWHPGMIPSPTCQSFNPRRSQHRDGEGSPAPGTRQPREVAPRRTVLGQPGLRSLPLPNHTGTGTGTGTGTCLPRACNPEQAGAFSTRGSGGLARAAPGLPEGPVSVAAALRGAPGAPRGSTPTPANHGVRHNRPPSAPGPVTARTRGAAGPGAGPGTAGTG